MKRVMISILNSLVQEAVVQVINGSGTVAECLTTTQPDDIIYQLKASFAQVFLLDITRREEGLFENRMKLIQEIRQELPGMKICLLVDNLSHPDVLSKVKAAKREGWIDCFFYENVSSDYLKDVLDTL